VFGIEFDPIDQTTLIGELLRCARKGRHSCVVPTNLHVVIRARIDAEMRLVLADPAVIVVPDGRPIVWMARLRRITMPHVTGSDLVVPLCHAAAREQLSVFLFGTTFDTLAECARRLSASIKGLRIAGVYSPPFGFERDGAECELAARVIQAAAPDIVFVALGVPKQELWAHKYAKTLKLQVICAGASLDFVAGAQRRAPLVFRRTGFEWLWRMVTEPGRLGLRYLTILVWLPFLVIGDLAAAMWRRTR
jgi:N-acetylglucosaminyldiphosphoundecaprenol N-acetyl-beta-D-mannosaminyltransferase